MKPVTDSTRVYRITNKEPSKVETPDDFVGTTNHTMLIIGGLPRK